MKNYAERLHSRMTQLGTSALVGLDPRWNLLPEEIRKAAEEATGDECRRQANAFEHFCREIIDIVSPLVAAVKPQVAFFEQLGNCFFHRHALPVYGIHGWGSRPNTRIPSTCIGKVSSAD